MDLNCIISLKKKGNTSANIDDRNENVIFSLISRVNPFSYLFRDKEYISKKLKEKLLTECNIELITKKRKNMK
jgi:hypothetical protein